MTQARRSERILLVEDDPVIGEATSLHLERHGYDVTWAQDGLDAWHAFEGGLPDGAGAPEGPHGSYDLVLSDVMLPGIDGVTLCRRVRDAGRVPVVLLSARTDAVDVVGGLEAGADDYVTKPFDVQVLLARLRSVLRRAEPPAGPAAGPPAGPAESGDDPDEGPAPETYGAVSLDRRTLEVRRDGEPVSLTPTEMRLLLELVDARGAVLSRGQLLQRVWDYEDWEDDAHLVNVHVQRLRAKVGAELVETVRGFGYRLAT